MSFQSTLFDVETQSRFDAYHAENPQVYAMFERFTLEALRRGANHLGAAAVRERIRWETSVSGNDGYKFNNVYTPYFARLFVQNHPEHAGVFRTRKAKADDEMGLES